MRFKNLVGRASRYDNFVELIRASKKRQFSSTCKEKVIVGFDWHGTLYHLYPHHFLIPLNKTREKFGRAPLPSLPPHTSLYGVLAKTAGVELSGSTKDVKEIEENKKKLNLATSYFVSYYRKNVISPVGLLPGVVKTLNSLRENGFELFVISNHIEELLLHDIKSAGLLKYFTYIIGTNGPGDYKPSDKMFTRLRQGLPERDKKSLLYYVGDQPSDIEAAQSAKCSTILVNDKHFLNIRHHPDYWVNEVSMLPSLLLHRIKSSTLENSR